MSVMFFGCSKVASLTKSSVNITSEEDMTKFAQGTWSCNWLPTTGKPRWSKFVFNAGGTGERYAAPVVADNWGQATAIEWKTVTGKNPTTGKRWYGVNVPDPQISYMLLFIEKGNDLLKSDDDTKPLLEGDNLFLVQDNNVITDGVEEKYIVPCTHTDEFPFSK